MIDLRELSRHAGVSEGHLHKLLDHAGLGLGDNYHSPAYESLVRNFCSDLRRQREQESE
jgi:hypothetical protein